MILPKPIYSFCILLIQTLAEFFCWNGQADSEVYMESKQSRRAKTILKSNKAGELTQLDFKTDNKATVIKTVCRQLHQRNRTENQNRPTYTWSINFQQQKKSFQQIVLEQMDIYKREKEPQNSNYPNIA